MIARIKFTEITAGAGAAPQTTQTPGITLPAAVLDRYVGEYTTTTGSTLTVSRNGMTLLMKQGGNPEVPLAARLVARFLDPRGLVLEFQFCGAGTVAGLVIEQGSQRILAARTR